MSQRLTGRSPAWVGCLVLATLLGCGGGGEQKGVRVDGSSTVYLISEKIAEDFLTVDSSTRVTVGVSGTGGGMKKFALGEIDVCDASRRIKESEKEACAAKGIEFIELPVAYDGLALVVSQKNDWCQSLTVEQLKKLWEPESPITKWNELDPTWPEEPITLFGPGTDSGTFDYFTETICGKEKASRSFQQSEDDNVIVTGVASDPHAMGYFGFAYYMENQDKLRLVAVDPGDGNAVAPSEETVRDGTYKPLSRPLFIYVNKASLARPRVRKFVEFYLSHVGKIASEVGYVALPDAEAEASATTLKSATGAE